MKGITIYQCLPSYKPLATVRLIKSIIDSNCKILIDLEDSIQDVQNADLTPELKSKARQDFAEIIRHLPNQKVNLRINSVKSDEFQKDKMILRQFTNNIESVFIPKVESSNDLMLFSKEVGDTYKLNLIIETQQGVENLDEILSSKFNNSISFIFFGNYDFHLDSNIYPITEQNTFKYWKIVEPIISKVEKWKKGFGNSPYANISDTNCLDFSVTQLTKLCKRNFAVMSLHKTQTLYFQKLVTEWNSEIICSNKNIDNEFTLTSFTNYKQKGRSFAFDNNRIITPQEYLLLYKKQNG